MEAKFNRSGKAATVLAASAVDLARARRSRSSSPRHASENRAVAFWLLCRRWSRYKNENRRGRGELASFDFHATRERSAWRLGGYRPLAATRASMAGMAPKT